MALHATGLIEGDLKYAEEIWEALSAAFEQLGQPIPTHLVLNRATSLFWQGQYDSAKQTFEEVLARDDLSNVMRAGVLPTLSACLREIGDRVSSNRRLAEARELMAAASAVDPEHGLELELIGAKNAVTASDFPEVCACLRRAISWLDDAVDLVEKLHYRRGLRERFIPRIENLLVTLPRNGRSDDVLAVIAATRSNRLSDWLHFLAWTRQLKTSLSAPEIVELDDLIESLANHGAPHLMGFHEKYDDPMATDMLPDPWRSVAEYADRMCAVHGLNRPFARANAAEAELLLKQRLDEGYAVLVNLLTADRKALLLHGDHYTLCDLPDSETAAFAVALYKQRQSPDTSKPLAVAVGAYQSALLRCLESALNELAATDCKGLLFLPDRMDLTPINLVLLSHGPTRKRMAAGRFSVGTCLALYPAEAAYVAPKVALGVLEGDSGLAYDEADLKAFFEGSGTYATTLDKPNWEEFSSQMMRCDALVLAHHGMSVGMFTDPTFADMGGPFQHTVMSVSRLQQAAYLWPHRLAVLGTCHSGGLVNRNFQKSFKSHDLMGFPSVFLLNGMAEVVAASWAIIDRFNLMFTSLFAPALRDMRPAAAVSHALASLIDMSDDDLQARLNATFPADHPILQAVSQLNVLRRQPYCYGAYQTYTLL
jgi:tetratricopeptide (TPR) repeat protein